MPHQDTAVAVKSLKERIMRRVYVVFMVRNLSPFAFDCVVAVVLIFIATLFVSVGDVLANFSTASTGGGLSRFSVAALSDTELETKLLLFVLGVVGFLGVRDLKRATRAMKTLRGKNTPKG
ncbi:MAG: hypothetical protein A2849_03415 [Candidatus Taylorbacteria bacterium RIFCSPHIGHO2_01_FULL_51_15]|uniref:Uncharacterized protein n=1 Tax=Candidatus Taylorbacteria bacterium RIFCSPHIGHO2_01_FULL_51_15 TaxID=1802304 RepID=A0A1G2MAB1_9BACT|nr:MAG: hypothetical protein A2849_03415 [Candidatus Taylorbacteria bacterium RIFCSPHIGHO2_01_FULL_51_15]